MVRGREGRARAVRRGRARMRSPACATLELAVFADLKLHDIPTTVERAARVLGGYGAAYVNFHAAGGVDMMRGGVDGLADGARATRGCRPRSGWRSPCSRAKPTRARSRRACARRRRGLRRRRVLGARGRGGRSARAADLVDGRCRASGSRATTATISGGSGHRRPSPRPAPTCWWSGARSPRPRIRRASRAMHAAVTGVVVG